MLDVAEVYARDLRLREEGAILAEQLYAKATARILRERCLPGGPLRVLDISANDLWITAKVCQELDKILPDGTSFSMRANDPSYEKLGNKTPLLKEAEERAAGVNTKRAIIGLPLLAKSAENLKPEDLGGQVDVVLDRLGAIWHAIRLEEQEKVVAILGAVRAGLSVDGVFILDGTTTGMGTGFSTADTLELLALGLGEKSMKDFLSKQGFSCTQRRENDHNLLVLTKQEQKAG